MPVETRCPNPLRRMHSLATLCVLAVAAACLFTPTVSEAEESKAAASESSEEKTLETPTSADPAPEAPVQAEHTDGWEYDTDYIFPLTRHMPESGLPRGGQIALYPLAFLIDLGQWPVGALAGLAGK